MPTEREPEAVIKRLVQLTQEGRIEWERRLENGEVTQGTDDLVDLYYLASHKGHKFRVYEVRSRCWEDEHVYYWTSDNRLETVDDQNRVLWQFPPSRWTNDLIKAVVYQSADVDGMFGAILDDKDE